ncbi:DUF4352 domain-containing protein [Corynebacterium comes]|uniref:Telomeric repeat-binding factor 2 n=1 Tax=Corynebacterium comes TaxID=2675218 RepID=A0A6B8VLG9_9CORY|nr:DUF4352 domain-containing protein [Corynebacterium comes]QGU03899.1 Telomeric repeat-binding factor 2 [Corynebacterium comes]
MTSPDSNQPQPFNQAYAPAPEPKQKKKKWLWIVGIGAVLVLFANIGGGDSDDEASTAADDTAVESVEAVETVEANDVEAVPAAAPAEEAAPVEEQPSTLTIGESGETGGMNVTVGNARFASDVLGNYICTDVALMNNADSKKSFNQFDFELEKPNGVVANTTFTGLAIKNLEIAELNPGGTTDGTVCFDSDGTPGEYRIVYKGGFFNAPLTWSAAL